MNDPQRGITVLPGGIASTPVGATADPCQHTFGLMRSANSYTDALLGKVFWRCIGCDQKFAEVITVQPVERVTDDRPADTIPERYKRDFNDAAGWHNGSYIQQLHREIGQAEAALRELVGHVNSLPEGHYSAWLTWWAKEAVAKIKGAR